jgi:broad specificity phosphatase PhoE
MMRLPFWRGVRHVYASTERKAEVVAAAANAEHGIPFSLHSELAELARPAGLMADYQGRVMALFGSPSAAPDGWEPLDCARERAWKFLTTVVGEGPLPAAAVSHGMILSAVRARLLGRDEVDPRDWVALPFGAVAEVESEGWTVVEDFRAG